MRRFIHIITVMAMAVSCSSKYEGTTINIPEKMIKIENGAVSEYEYKPTGKPTLIIYYGQDECSVCVAEKLKEHYETAILRGAAKKHEVMVILSPNVAEQQIVQHIVLVKKYPFPIYIDEDNLYFKTNATIISRYRFVLLDNMESILKLSNRETRIKKI